MCYTTDNGKKMEGKLCFSFPGQLLEIPNLENDILGDTTLTHEIIKKAYELIGFEWSTCTFRDSVLNKYLNLRLQIVSYLISIIYAHYLMREGIVPDIISEHSMGIYAALVASDTFTFEEGLELIFSIGILIEKRAQYLNCAMASIIGLTEDDLLSIFNCLNTHKLFIANYNGSRQFVVSGEREGIQKTIELAINEYHAIAARELILTAPLHCELLEGIKEDLVGLLSGFSPREGTIPVINHLTADISNREGIRRLLCEEIYKPVLWDRCVHKLIEYGANLFIEVGYGETIRKTVRWIDKDISVLTIKDKKSIKEIKRHLSTI